jgi:hypothetical protein
MHPGVLCRISVVTILCCVVAGCLDMETTNLPATDYRSYIRFINLAVPAGPITNLQVDNASIGPVAVGDAGAHNNLPAGWRFLRASFSSMTDTLTRKFETDAQGTMFILGDATSRTYHFCFERYSYQQPVLSGEALVRVYHAIPDAGELTVIATANSSSITLAENLGYGMPGGYVSVRPPATLILIGIAGSDTLFRDVSCQTTLPKRYTVTVYDSTARVTVKLLEDD